ncbi:hypothetical protein ABZP36_010199 [Zizania latifolia]
MSPTSPRLPGARNQATTTAPFKLHRGSHLIHKQASSSSSSSTNSSVSSSSGPTNNAAAHRQPPRQQPVIIYTHSPKVIRTNPRDFMSIVQKLTGIESSAAARAGASSPPPAANNNSGARSAGTSHDESSSSTESCANARQTHAAPPPPYMDPQQMPAPAPPLVAHFMPEIPFFAPGTSDLLCASMGLYDVGPFAPVDAVALGPVMSSTSMNSCGASGGS